MLVGYMQCNVEHSTLLIEFLYVSLLIEFWATERIILMNLIIHVLSVQEYQFCTASQTTWHVQFDQSTDLYCSETVNR